MKKKDAEYKIETLKGYLILIDEEVSDLMMNEYDDEDMAVLNQIRGLIHKALIIE